MESKKFYDATAHLYDERQNNPTDRYMRGEEQKLIDKYSKGLVLDIGCGTGVHLARMKNAVGIDISHKMLEHARKKSRSPLVQGAAESLPFAGESFDTMICIFAVLNFSGLDVTIAEMRRVLKPGGTVIATVSSRWKECHSFLKSLIKEVEEKETTVRIEGFRLRSRVLTRSKFLEAFTSRGFTTVHSSGIFKCQKPYWGWKRDFTKAERLKLKIDRIIPSRASRVHFGVFRKVI